MLQFQTLNIEENRDKIIDFRRDSFVASFGDDSAFGAEDEYINWLKGYIHKYPDGFVQVIENEAIIGQLELSIREYNGKNIGYVHLYYLIPAKRDNGLGKKLHDYARKFFQKNGVNEYHLRVSPSNTRAIHFYQKNGMEKVGYEADGKVIRMKGSI